jgi:carboxyl-terminal processing protease
METFMKRTAVLAGGTLIIFGAFIGGYYVAVTSRVDAIERTVADQQIDLTEFWETLEIVRERFVAKDGSTSLDNDVIVRGAIRGMVDALGDPYTLYMDDVETEDFAEDIKGSFEGVGMEIGLRDEALVVISPLKGSPAEKAGMRTGDVILKIGATSTVGIEVEEAVSYIRGPKGTSVSLLVGREGEREPITVEIARAAIIVPTVETEKRNDGVFVISLYSFNQQAVRQFKQALKEFVVSKTDMLVLDLRGNPGGYLESAVDIASWFLPAGKVVVTEEFGSNAKQEPEIMRSKGYELFGDNLKMVVLVNEGSASASEILAGALQDHNVAKLVGEPTFGKGSVQELIKLRDGASLKITIARWLTPDGRSISDGGLTPDVEVKFDRERFEKDTYDTQLERAVEEVKKLK